MKVLFTLRNQDWINYNVFQTKPTIADLNKLTKISKDKNAPLTMGLSCFPVYGAVPSTITDEEHLKATIQRLVSYKNFLINNPNIFKYMFIANYFKIMKLT